MGGTEVGVIEQLRVGLLEPNLLSTFLKKGWQLVYFLHFL